MKAATLQTGNVFQYKYLGVNSQVAPPDDDSFITGLHDKMGLGGSPAYTITPTLGTVTDTHYVARLAAAGYGFSGSVQIETGLPMDLPVMISGLNPNWDAGIWYQGTSTIVIPYWTTNELGQMLGARLDLTGTDQVIHIPILSDGTNVGTGILQIDGTAGTKTVYIGNLLICDNPNIILTLTDTQAGTLSFVANNPTDSSISCTVQPGPGFTLLGNFSQPITVPAGSSTNISSLLTVSITSPSPGAVFQQGTAIPINTNANDSNGTITQAVFYADGTVIGTVFSSPYSYTWTNATLGTHSLTVAVTDNAGAVTVSSAVSITVDDIPVCTMTAPANNTVYTTPPASIMLSASVNTKQVGTISSVKFYDCTQGNTTLLYTATSSPYNYTWTSPAAGSYTLTALATDSYGATASSAVNITVDNITCSMTAPTNGKVYSTASVQHRVVGISHRYNRNSLQREILRLYAGQHHAVVYGHIFSVQLHMDQPWCRDIYPDSAGH